MGVIRDSFVIFKNWTDAINALPEEYQLETYKAVVAYGINGVIPENLSPIANAMLISFSKGMENNILRYHASVENGKKGGAPKGNQNAKKKVENEVVHSEKQPENNLEQPKTNKNNLNVNVNVNDNVKLVNNNLKNNKFNFNYINTCARVRERTDEERKPYLIFYSDYFNWCFSEEYKQIGYEIIDTIIEAREQALEEGLKFNYRTFDGKSFTNLVINVGVDSFRSIVTQLKFNQDIHNRPYYILGCLVNASNNKENSMTQEQMERFIKDMEERSEIFEN